MKSAKTQDKDPRNTKSAAKNASTDDVTLSGNGKKPGPPNMTLLDNGEQCEMVEYAPNKWAAMVPPDNFPRFGIVRFVHVRQNEWRPTVVGWGRYVALSSYRKTAADGLRKLGIDLSYNSILRLYKNGFIRGSMPTPHRILIDIQSLYEHMQATTDPDYWTKARREQFNEVLY